MKKSNILILAAGRGRRLGKKTLRKPKPLMVFKNRSILDYQFEVFQKYPKAQINMVLGYQAKKIKNFLKKKKVKYFINNEFKNTNMFFSFLKAKSLLNQKKDLLIIYGDIIFKQRIFNKLINDANNLSISVDLNFLSYWKKRMKNPLKDLETMKIKKKYITELGKKPHSYKEIQAQYMGLIKISFKKFDKIKKIIRYIKKNNKDYKNLYFTDFIQIIIDNNIKARAVEIHGGWQEFDKPKDFIIDNFNL